MKPCVQHLPTSPVSSMAFLIFKRPKLSVSDSEAFHDVLNLWQPMIAAKPYTPRFLKRFRGTEPNQITDWITDLAFMQSSHSPYPGRVHDGFFAALATRGSGSTIHLRCCLAARLLLQASACSVTVPLPNIFSLFLEEAHEDKGRASKVAAVEWGSVCK